MTPYQSDYLSESLKIPTKVQNYLNRDYWYHGTSEESVQNIIEQGVLANYNIGSSLDFGPGFYLTNTLQKAENYISRVPYVSDNGTLVPRQE